ncbi:hypothetical protein GJ496_003249 [Pomphorhynchus laevis]|nr:hypothetical protein GJ496_003249 [Pomphorhynchus laevis]
MDQQLLARLCKDDNFINEYKKIIKFRIMMKLNKPKFYVDLKNVDYTDKSGRGYSGWITMNDIQKMLVNVAVPTLKLPLRWCRILRRKTISKSIVIVVNGICCSDTMTDQNGQTVKVSKFMPCMSLFDESVGGGYVSFLHANSGSFISELKDSRISVTDWEDEKESRSLLCTLIEVNVDKVIDNMESRKAANLEDMSSVPVVKVSKMDLILSANQLLRLGVPLPCFHDTRDYTYLHRAYAPVTSNSPVFAIDCEMVVTRGQRLHAAWVAIVNENNECVFESLIKPSGQVIDYVTRISGVNKHLLSGCKTTLHMVKQSLSSIISNDAILVGHNISSDLHALHMYHPYLIDTSTIFNIIGSRGHTPSLKDLAFKFLGKLIQEEDGHHSPVEDAAATMSLLQYKLKNGLLSGDAVICGMSMDEDIVAKISRLPDQDVVKSLLSNTKIGYYKDLFTLLSEHKDVFVVGRDSQSPCDSINYVKCESNQRAVNHAIPSISTHDFIFCQFYVCDIPREKKILKISRYIQRIYDSSPENAFISILFTGQQNLGRVYVTTKCEESIKPLVINGLELPHNFRPSEFLKSVCE